MASDDLRTRIAAVLRTYMFENSTAEELADAVIAELGLKREYINPGNRPGDAFRYATEWEN